jgi:streptogramin lyase
MSARTASLLVAVCALALTAPLPSFGAPPSSESMIEQVFRLRTEAVAAAKAGDLATAEARLTEARRLFPTSPGVLIRLARVQTANGHPEAAVATLNDYANLGLALDVAADPALKDLAARPDFAPVATRLKANTQPLGRAEPMATLERRDFIGEGVLILPDGDLLVSGVAAKTILRIHDGQAKSFLQGDAETGALFGMSQAPDRSIWVAEAWGADLPGGSGPGRTGLLKLSPDGKVLARYPAPEARQFGDLVVDANGAVFASDSVGGGVWRLNPRENAPTLFAQSNWIKSPQGLAICGSALLLADYSSGFFRIDRFTGQVSSIPTPNRAALAGIDGLAPNPAADRSNPYSRSFIATQNGVQPQRVMDLRLDLNCYKLTLAEPRLANLDGIDDLSLGTASKDRYVFLGHSQWGAWGGEGKPADDAEPVRLYSLPLP